jgi:hypothetical protein
LGIAVLHAEQPLAPCHRDLEEDQLSIGLILFRVGFLSAYGMQLLDDGDGNILKSSSRCNRAE